MPSETRRCETCGDLYSPYGPCSCMELADKFGIASRDLEDWIVKVIAYQLAKHEQNKANAEKLAPSGGVL
jgi:hypothetical protein